eukprot:3936480-Rhodomonas_salina.1
MNQGHYASVYGAWTGNTVMNVAVRNTKWKPSIVAHARTAVAAYFTLQTLAWVATRNICKGLESPLPAQPRSQRDARSRSDWERWLKAEQIEMATCFDK